MKKTEEQIKEEIKEWLSGSDDSDFCTIAEEFLDDNNYYDDIYRDMCDLDDDLDGKTPTEILLIDSDDFSLNDDYYRFDGLGNLESTNNKARSYYEDYVDDIVDWLFDGNGSNLDSDLEEIIEQQNDDDDESEVE